MLPEIVEAQIRLMVVLLPAPLSNQADHLARRHGKIHVPQRRLVRFIAEGGVLERHRASDSRH